MDSLLAVGVTFTFSQFIISRAFTPEDRLQAIAVIAILLSAIVIITFFIRYAFLLFQAKVRSTPSKAYSRRETTLRIAAPSDQIFNQLLQQSPIENWKLLQVQGEQKYLRFYTPFNWHSLGEIVEIKVEPLDEEASWVQLRSCSLHPKRKNDSGANYLNIKEVENMLGSL